MPQGRGRGQPGAPARDGRQAGAPGGGSAGGGPAALAEQLTKVIEPVTEGSGYDLERVTITRIGRRHSLRVIIDADGGVGLDAIAEVSHAVSAALDAAEETGAAVIPGEYVLEVSSPGVDRPLTEPRHWRRNIGRLVAVAGPDGATLTGRVTEVTEAAVVLEIEGDRRELLFDQLGPGRIQVELRRPGEPDELDDEGEG